MAPRKLTRRSTRSTQPETPSKSQPPQRSTRATQPKSPSRSQPPQRSSRQTKLQAGPSRLQGSARLSQLSIEESFSEAQHTNENLEEHVNKFVRYVLYRAGNNLPLRKADIQKTALKSVGRAFDQIVKKATVILKNIYGYDLYLDGEANTKSYLVSNLMPYKAVTENKDDEEDTPKDVHKILILLVLSHIFMSGNVSSEAALFLFLRSLQIDPEKKHDLFGNVTEFITVTMVKQRYLNTEIEDVTKRVLYSWGSKADHEISKHSVLKFVCNMYKDRTPRSWTSQFKEANAQNSEDAEEVVESGDDEQEESD